MYAKTLIFVFLALCCTTTFAAYTAKPTTKTCLAELTRNENHGFSDYVENAVNSGYQNINNDIKTFTIGGEKVAIMFLAFTGEAEIGNARERGTLRLRYRAANLKDATKTFAHIVDMFLTEPTVNRSGTNIVEEPGKKRIFNIHNDAESETYVNGQVDYPSAWTSDVSKSSIIYSNKSLNASVYPDYYVDYEKPEYAGLTFGEGDIVVTIQTHPGRNESINSERIFRALFNYGKPE